MKNLLFALACHVFLFAPALAAGPDEVPRITPAELKAKFDAQAGVVILDVRTQGSYAVSKFKIKGAVRIPPNELSARAAELPMGAEIVTYCT